MPSRKGGTYVGGVEAVPGARPPPAVREWAPWERMRQLRTSELAAAPGQAPALATAEDFWRAMVEVGLCQHTRAGDGWDWQWVERDHGAAVRTAAGVTIWWYAKPRSPPNHGKIILSGGTMADGDAVLDTIEPVTAPWLGMPPRCERRRIAGKGSGPAPKGAGKGAPYW